MIAGQRNPQNGRLPNRSVSAHEHGKQIKTSFIDEDDRSLLFLGFFSRMANSSWQPEDTGGRSMADLQERGCMTEADPADTYEQQVQAIQGANQPILDGFENALRQAGLSEPTIKAHVDNMRFFGRYLLWYGSSLRQLDEATE